MIVFVYLTKLVNKHLHCLTKPDVRSEVAIGSCNLSRYGVPREFLSDRKANLLSELMRGVCLLTRMAKINTTAAHPETDRLVENFNKTSKTVFAKYSQSVGCNWDVHLQQLLFANQTKPHMSTELPFYLLYGRDPRLPTEMVLEMIPSPYVGDLRRLLSGADEGGVTCVADRLCASVERVQASESSV